MQLMYGCLVRPVDLTDALGGLRDLGTVRAVLAFPRKRDWYFARMSQE